MRSPGCVDGLETRGSRGRCGHQALLESWETIRDLRRFQTPADTGGIATARTPLTPSILPRLRGALNHPRSSAAYARAMHAPRERWVWLRRTRWRLRGAYAGAGVRAVHDRRRDPARAAPGAGDTGPGLLGALLIAGFVNLFAVAVIGPLLGVWLRRRDPARPAFAARDRGAVYALAAMCAVLLAGGLANRDAVRGEAGDLRAQARAARSWFAHRAPDRYRSAAGQMTTWKAGEDLYRTCVPAARAGARALRLRRDRPVAAGRHARQQPGAQQPPRRALWRHRRRALSAHRIAR